MSSNETNRPGSKNLKDQSDPKDSPIIRVNAGGSPQVTGAANEEHIVSGPSFFEKLFGTPLAKDTAGKGAGGNTASTTGDATAAASTTPASGEVSKDGAASGSDTAGSGAKEEDKKEKEEDKKEKEERKPFVYREPEGPFKPHYPSTRSEMLYDPPTPTVYLTPDAYKRMCLYVELAPKEVGWLGTISKRPDGNFLIEEVFLVEQEVTPVETELSVQGSEKLVLELLEGGDPGLEKANKLHFWGHSHVRMGTSPSGTDESTMMRFSREGHEYYVRGIFNKLGRACFDVYYYKEGYRLLDVPWAVLDPATGKTLLERGSGYGARKWWQGGPSNSSDRPYGHSSYPSWRERQEQEAKQKDEQSGLADFLKKDDATPAPAPKKVDPLAISAELRAEVTAEYHAKVKERAPAIFRWFGKKDDKNEKDGDDQNGQGGPGGSGDGDAINQATRGPDDVGGQVTDGDLIPTGNDVRRTTGSGSVPRVPNTSIKGAATEEEKKGGFFAWLGSLFESDPTPPQPTYQQGERPRKKCTPQNCNDATHPWSTNYKGPKSGSPANPSRPSNPSNPSNPNSRADRLPDDAQ
ncbi:MAG: hypothetical protein IT343_08595 [Candidatus Melainabacteria bacterium]|nr:hypothetical protein [Candidatus Melainabacteria bacterium]